MKKYLATTIVVLAGLYEVAAQTTTGPAAGIANLGSIISTFNKSVVASLGVLFLAIAVVTFFFGVIRFIWGQQHGDAKAQAVGKSFLVWGLVGIFVAFSVYGIVRFAQTIIPGGNKTTIDKPCVDFVNGCAASPGSGGANPFDGSTAGGGASGSSGGAGSGTGAEGDCGSKAIGATCTFNGATGRCADASYGGAKYCNTTTSFDGSSAAGGGANGGSSGGGATAGSGGTDVNGLDDTITCASVGMGGACRENGIDGTCVESSDGMRFICQPDSGSDR